MHIELFPHNPLEVRKPIQVFAIDEEVGNTIKLKLIHTKFELIFHLSQNCKFLSLIRREAATIVNRKTVSPSEFRIYDKMIEMEKHIFWRKFPFLFFLVIMDFFIFI